MRRGRWVAYCIAILSFFFAAQPLSANTLSMSASVPVSPLWKQAIQNKSETKLDTSHPHILLISQYSLGLENIPVENQLIQLLVFKNAQVVFEQTKVTNKKGSADFVFVSEKTDSYKIIVVNKTDTSPFIVRSATISL